MMTAWPGTHRTGRGSTSSTCPPPAYGSQTWSWPTPWAGSTTISQSMTTSWCASGHKRQSIMTQMNTYLIQNGVHFWILMCITTMTWNSTQLTCKTSWSNWTRGWPSAKWRMSVCTSIVWHHLQKMIWPGVMSLTAGMILRVHLVLWNIRIKWGTLNTWLSKVCTYRGIIISFLQLYSFLWWVLWYLNCLTR